VVALMDGKTLNTWSAHAVQDALLTWVYRGAEGAAPGDGADLARHVQ
jgi:hypothetical protein